jgi:hypothetical protein
MTELVSLPAAFFGALLLYRFVCGCMGLETGFRISVIHIHEE